LPVQSACESQLLIVTIWSYRRTVVLNQGYEQGCSANKKSVGTHPKNGHYQTASNSISNAKCEKGLGTPFPSHYTPAYNASVRRGQLLWSWYWRSWI